MSSAIRTVAQVVRESEALARTINRNDPGMGLLRTQIALMVAYYADLHDAYLALQQQRANADVVLNATFPTPDDEPIGPVSFVPRDSATPAAVQEFVNTQWGAMPVGGGA